MRVLTIFNEQREFGGEEVAVRDTVNLLRSRGVDTEVLHASSRDLSDSLADKVRAAASGIYSVSSHRRALSLLRSFDPDVVHAHNVYPLLSPSVLAACRQEGYPVVFTAHSQILTCPTWYNTYDGKICEKCFGGGEYACVVHIETLIHKCDFSSTVTPNVDHLIKLRHDSEAASHSSPVTSAEPRIGRSVPVSNWCAHRYTSCQYAFPQEAPPLVRRARVAGRLMQPQLRR